MLDKISNLNVFYYSSEVVLSDIEYSLYSFKAFINIGLRFNNNPATFNPCFNNI